MIISTNWLKKFTEIDMPIEELAVLIGARLVEIEEVIDLGSKYKDVVTAKVVTCEPVEGSDHLNVTTLDDAGVTPDIERNEDGHVQVVCGAPNVRVGMMVAWLPPKTVVPETADDAEPFVLGARKLRGVMSNGMIASAKELALFDEHDGILELDADIELGTSFAKAYELDDYLFDIENKSLTHRPDCFGIIGFAREVAAIQSKAFETPEWLVDLTPDYGDKEGDVIAPKVTIDDAALSDRYQAVVLTDGNGGAISPLKLQTYLARVGIRPISAVVDVTNYLMMLTGQPLHAFDYDKLVAVGGSTDIHVRAGREQEKLVLLDGRTIELTSDDIVIAAGDVAIGLAGAMGGAETEIDASTKNIIIESATFNLYKLRGTQMRHGIFSEAITRFTKGQAASQTAPVLAEAVHMMNEFAGTKRASDVADSHPEKYTQATIELTADKVNDTLGTKLSTDNILHTLENVEFDVAEAHQEQGSILAVKAPYWRADIHIDEDIIEEVGRLSGFDSITPTLPHRDFTAVNPSSFDELRAEIRRVLVRAGANEVLTYSFVHGDVLKKALQDPENSYRLTNSLSPDLQYFRQSITPSLLGLVHGNIKNGYDTFALFELNKVHSKTAELVAGVPPEMHRIGLTLANKKQQSGSAYYQAKRLLEYLGGALGLTLEYKQFTSDASFVFAKPFELRRSARVIDVASNQSIGIVGEYKKVVSRNFKLPEYAAGFELLTEGVALALQHKKGNYSPISRFPSSERDICFQVVSDIMYQQIIQSAMETLGESQFETTVTPVDIYQSDNDSPTKNITVRTRLTSHDRTLTGDDVTSVIEAVIAKVCADTGAVVV
jgi:phenylalanyl-tRNA synthetase beta chain